MSSSYDAIVVGAGPGGATAAYHLAKHGLRVLVLEKDRMPRYKACGGGIPLKVVKALDFDVSPTYEDTISGCIMSYKSGQPVRTDFGHEAGWCVMRSDFDYYLAQQATAAGAKLRDGHGVERIWEGQDGVRVSAKSDEYSAQFLVGADGANGPTARAMGLMDGRLQAVALEAEIRVTSTALEAWRGLVHFDFGSLPLGYAWVFPKAQHLSVGVGTFLPSGPKIKLRAYLNRFIQSQPLLRDYRDIFTRGHLVPLGGWPNTIHKGRVLLVGDAAGLADPFTGEGIYFAIRSGQLAAEVIGDSLLRGDSDLSSYNSRVDAEIQSDFLYAKQLAVLFYRFPAIGFRLYALSSTIREQMQGVIEGSRYYRDTFARSLGWLGGLMLRAPALEYPRS